MFNNAVIGTEEILHCFVFSAREMYSPSNSFAGPFMIK